MCVKMKVTIFTAHLWIGHTKPIYWRTIRKLFTVLTLMQMQYAWSVCCVCQFFLKFFLLGHLLHRLLLVLDKQICELLQRILLFWMIFTVDLVSDC